MKKTYIPEITTDELKARAAKIRPVVRMRGFPVKKEKLYYIKPVDIEHTAFTWNPKPDYAAKNLVPLQTITTYHSYGYYGCFKPSIAEVLAQIPDGLLSSVVAFETHGPETAADLNKDIEALNDGYHVAETTLYKRE